MKLFGAFAQHGRDGFSLFCGLCGNYEYTNPPEDGVFTCKLCGCSHTIFAREVECASPDHNEPGGCSNEKCWKFLGQ